VKAAVRAMIEDDVVLILKRSKLFKGLSDDDIEQVCRLTMPSERFFDKNQIIINQGESVRRIGIIKSGTVISMKYHFNGDTQILRIYKRGEVISLDAVNTSFLTSPAALISQSDCSIIFIPYRKLFDSSITSPSMKEIIMFNSSEILSNELVRLMYKIDVLSKRTLQDRIMTYLSIIREKKGKDTIDIGMNQEEFAHYLCVNRSVLSKELNLMRKDGMIDYKKNRYTLFKHIND
jgi:CRP-like cAMP-binding protein